MHIITNSDSNVTIYGGKGNVLITLTSDSHYTAVKYTSGDSKDTIYGLDSDDTLQITGAEYTTAKSGNDLIIGVGNDLISVVGGANVAFKINGTLKSNIGAGNDTIGSYYENARTVIKYVAGDGDDVISNINDNDTLQIYNQ